LSRQARATYHEFSGELPAEVYALIRAAEKILEKRERSVRRFGNRESIIVGIYKFFYDHSKNEANSNALMELVSKCASLRAMLINWEGDVSHPLSEGQQKLRK
jgi:hypothetical protein